MTKATQIATVSDKALQAALLEMAKANVPSDVQRLLIHGYDKLNTAPNSIRNALAAALPHLTALSSSETAQGEQQDYFGELVNKARTAADKAMVRFPQPNYITLKIAEEAGEVVRGAVHYAEGRLPWEEVEGEIVQLMAMLMRFVTEGDQVNGITPPTISGKHTTEGGESCVRK